MWGGPFVLSGHEPDWHGGAQHANDRPTLVQQARAEQASLFHGTGSHIVRGTVHVEFASGERPPPPFWWFKQPIFERNKTMREVQLTAHVERDPETGLYIGMVPSIPGAHTQAKTLDELQANLKEVVELCFEEMSEEDIRALPVFVGLQSFSVAV